MRMREGVERLYDLIYADRGSLKEPEKKKKGKGRPKGSKNKPREQTYTQYEFQQADGPPQDELEERPDLYDFFFERDIPKHVRCIRHCQSPCPQPYRMMTYMDLLMYATRFNMIIFLYGRGEKGQNMNTCSYTVLPLIAPRGPNGHLTGPAQEIAMAHLGDYPHYIRLDFVVQIFQFRPYLTIGLITVTLPLLVGRSHIARE
ncbi:OLC1v1007456C1 [Oldenlandia corymbosa var. corymbosa]|uniref:OLC1v1007456C1 n=1 Tax=Oldenlandia corymbosa var. corymbosa TaxID=529605 RepID=A0AAV1DJJ1_OLDCO|nr:OLC1v1007456C1 [Oldenlandia corymbosa var. corymbosa]